MEVATNLQEPGNSVARIKVVGSKTRAEMFRVRMNVAEERVLDEVCSAMGGVSRAHAFRYLLEHYSDMKKAEEIVYLYTKMRASEKEFDDLIQQKVV